MISDIFTSPKNKVVLPLAVKVCVCGYFVHELLLVILELALPCSSDFPGHAHVSSDDNY